jgi:hypothetical protein
MYSPPTHPSPLRRPQMFQSLVGAGFECSSHIRPDGKRLDLLDGTGHAAHALTDYAAVASLGLGWARDGIGWDKAEPMPGAYRWDRWLRLLRAALAAGVTVAWDLFHFGYPDWLDIWSPDFPRRAADFAAAAARIQRAETGQSGIFCPVNEISFLSFAGGETGWWAPYGEGQGDRLKTQLVLAAIAMSRAIRIEDPGAQLLWAEPLIAVRSFLPERQAEAQAYETSQFQATDWLLGLARPELGGSPDLADWLGFNHYPHNQRWIHADVIPFGTPGYTPMAELLAIAAARYPAHRFFLAETGAEGPARSAWLRYVAEEVEAAWARGIPVDGICLYPVTDYPGWDDDRYCPTGLLGYPQADGTRPVDRRLLASVDAANALSRPPANGTERGDAPDVDVLKETDDAQPQR